MNDPNSPLGWRVWRRGALLGLQWLAVFFAATAAAYGVMGLLGWSGVLRALCAMGVGPVLAIGVIVAWWVIRRPALAPAATSDHRGSTGMGEDE